MTEQTPSPDLSDFAFELAGAQAALDAFARGPAQKAANDVADAFTRAGARIGDSLARAGADGEAAFKQLAKTVLEELAKLALERLFTQGGGAGLLNFFGARAAGGNVTPGGAYLVGERGPELFTPNTSGVISNTSAAPIEIHFHLGAGADGPSIARSQAQIAASVARAVAYGRRNL
ncbi:MAG: phage tail tape measure C-terminal domain-containing protein [Hyphomonadaceae bacterium]